jgi:lia operon protein LiaG
LVENRKSFIIDLYEEKEGIKMKRIVILLLVITGLYIVFNQSFSSDGFDFAGSKDESAKVSNSIEVIKVNVGGVSTTIIPQERQDVRAVLTGKGKLTVTEEGNMVEVKTKSKWFNWFTFEGKRQLKIYIPEDYNKDMDIDLGSGNLIFSGKSMKLDELHLDIGSGNVDLSNINVNQFSHDGSSGNVDIDTLTTEKGSFDLSSGNLNINHYTGALEADVSSGRLKIQMDELNDNIEIDVSSGTVDLDLPDSADFVLNGEVSSGSISSDFPLTTNGTDKKNINGTHGSGKYEINIDVSSGQVEIK